MTVRDELLYITFMRKILLFVLLLNVLGFGSKFEDEEIRRFHKEKLEAQRNYLGEVRDSLLQSLQAKDFEATSRYIELLTDSVFDAYALDKYELFQVYLLMDKLDSAVATFVRDYDNRLESYSYGSGYRYVDETKRSAFNDELNEYLNKHANLKTRENLRKQLNRALNADVSQEYKDLADLMSFVFERDTLKSRTTSETMRYGFWKNDFVEKDSVYFELLISKYLTFQKRYPSSEFYLWAHREESLERKKQNNRNFQKYYYREWFYTGGIGGEYFYSPSNGSYEWNIVLQYKRFILSANYGQDDDFHYGWNVLLGADVFENKYFKVVPFVGGYDPWMAGLQFEYRPWISELGHDAPIGGYLSLKAKYVFKYGENGCEAGGGKDGVMRCYVDGAPTGRERDKKLAKHRFYLGVGFHLW